VELAIEFTESGLIEKSLAALRSTVNYSILLLSKVLKQVVNQVTCNLHLLKTAKQSQLQTVFVIGAVQDTVQALTHEDAFTELLTRIFTSTPTKLVQRTGVTGERFVYKLLCKAQRQAVNLVTFSQKLLKNVKHLQKRAISVIGAVQDTVQALTHEDASTELPTRIFTSTPTRLVQRTGVTGERFVYEVIRCYKLV